MRTLCFPAIMLVLLAGCESTKQAGGHDPNPGAAHDQPAWNYEDHGPATWGELSPDYVLAKLGGSQSPVDIETREVIGADLPPIRVVSKRMPLRLLNTGTTIEVLCEGAASLEFGKKRYTLQQYHFHAPSEHTIDGRRAEVELHFVFSDGAGHLAVMAVLCDEGPTENADYIDLLGVEDAQKLVPEPGQTWESQTDLVDVSQLLPDSLGYFTYDGSLTTPPVTEGVRWFVLKDTVVLSRSQIGDFDRMYNRNNRPTQPLNARLILTDR